MKTAELIQIARKCGQRTTDCKDCALNGRDDCLIYLSGRLADKLEMALADISSNCSNCAHQGKRIDNTLCPECLIMPYRKNWRWRGDRDE